MSRAISDIMPLLGAIFLSTFFLGSNIAFAAHSPLNAQKPASHMELSLPFDRDSSTAGDSPLSDAPVTTAVQQDPIIAAIFRPSYPEPQRLTNMYKHYVDSEDIIMNARYSMKKYTDQLPGLKATSYVALDDILANVPTLKSHGIDIVGFDLEKAFSPDSDMNNPVDVMRRASIAAHNHGLKFMALPGYPFAGKHDYASQIARYCDYYVIQAEGKSGKPIKYYDYVTPVVNAIMNNHPSTVIITEASLNYGTVQSIEDCWAKVANKVDGLMIVYGGTAGQIDKLNQIYLWLKNNYGA